jgi:hypothetical protein
MVPGTRNGSLVNRENSTPDTLAERIVQLLRSSNRPLLAREIAERLRTDRSAVNQALYGGRLPAVRDESFRWRLDSGFKAAFRESAKSPLQQPSAGLTAGPATSHMSSTRLGPDPAAPRPLEVGAAGVEWAVGAFDEWVAAGHRGIAVAKSERWALALLLVAIEDHLLTRHARAAVVTTDQPLLVARSLKIVSTDVHIGGLHHLLGQSAITVYQLGLDTRTLRGEAIEALDGGPILLALLGCHGVGKTRAINHLEGPYQSRLAIDYPGPLLQSTMRLLRSWFGDPLPESSVQTEVLTDLSSSGEMPNYSTARERELRALFGDDWQLDRHREDGESSDRI